MAGIAKVSTSTGKLDTTFGCANGYVITDVVHGDPYPTQGPVLFTRPDGGQDVISAAGQGGLAVAYRAN
jgi:hypothetical protein